MSILIVFALCGLWHGARWTFVAWGLLHGLMQALEKRILLQFMQRVPSWIQRFYAVFLVIIGWVLFRCETFADAGRFLTSLGRLSDWWQMNADTWSPVVTIETLLAFGMGAVAVSPLPRNLVEKRLLVPTAKRNRWRINSAAAVITVFVFVLAVVKLVNSSFNTFIYFRF